MTIRLAHLGSLAGAGLLLCSCGGADSFLSRMNEPLSGGGNALDPPGYRDRWGDPVQVVEATGASYSAGEWVESSVPQAAFYRREPRSGDQPVWSLPVGTPLKVVSTSGTYVKVELESGQVGYVPAIMVAQKNAPVDEPIVPDSPVELPPPGSSSLSEAPEPEIAPLSVEEAQGVPTFIDPETDLDE